MQKLNSVTPGELLCHEFLELMNISQYRVAKETFGMSQTSVTAKRLIGNALKIVNAG